jgi:putative tryptophan/tyrosine transport system substrate-binding protein
MRRRTFIAGLGSAAAWPAVARAQQPALPVIGFLHSASPGPYARLVAAFQQGLGETGYVEGRNVAIEYRWANDQYDRLPALAADLVRRQVTVIAANFTAALATRAATTTIPIVFAGAADPVQVGLVASLARPGGNLTGATTLGGELEPKRLELLHELVPSGTAFAVLVNPTNPRVSEDTLRRLQPAARSLGLQLHVQNVSSELDFDTAFATLRQLQVGGLVIQAAAFFTNRSKQLAALALHHAVPTIYQTCEFAAAGGLLSYGGSFIDPYRLAGVYTGRILKGDKPADLPVQQSTKIELIINMKTAKALGLTIPLALIGRADEVIE